MPAPEIQRVTLAVQAYSDLKKVYGNESVHSFIDFIIANARSGSFVEDDFPLLALHWAPVDSQLVSEVQYAFSPNYHSVMVVAVIPRPGLEKPSRPFAWHVKQRARQVMTELEKKMVTATAEDVLKILKKIIAGG